MLHGLPRCKLDVLAVTGTIGVGTDHQLIVGVPYSTPGMIHNEARGGTPYSASTIVSAAGELQPTAEDLALAKVQGRRVAEAALALRSTK